MTRCRGRPGRLYFQPLSRVNIKMEDVVAIPLFGLAAKDVHEVVHARHGVAVPRRRPMAEIGWYHHLWLEPHQALSVEGPHLVEVVELAALEEGAAVDEDGWPHQRRRMSAAWRRR